MGMPHSKLKLFSFFLSPRKWKVCVRVFTERYENCFLPLFFFSNEKKAKPYVIVTVISIITCYNGVKGR